MDDFSQLQVTDTSTLVWKIRASAAFDHWIKQSNGEIDVRRYNLNPAIETADLYKSEFLAKLQFVPFGETRSGTVKISEQLSPDDFSRRLRQDSGFAGCYGNMPDRTLWNQAVWQTIASLMNVSERQSTDQLKELMGRYSWYYLTVKTDWFVGVGWDSCVMCLNDQGTQLSILAVSDTD